MVHCKYFVLPCYFINYIIIILRVLERFCTFSWTLLFKNNFEYADEKNHKTFFFLKHAFHLSIKSAFVMFIRLYNYYSFHSDAIIDDIFTCLTLHDTIVIVYMIYTKAVVTRWNLIPMTLHIILDQCTQCRRMLCIMVPTADVQINPSMIRLLKQIWQTTTYT